MPVTRLRVILYDGYKDKGKDQLDLLKRLFCTDRVESIGQTDTMPSCTYIVYNAVHGHTQKFVRSLFDVNCDCHAHLTVEQA